MIGNPYPLKQNVGKSFQGSIVLGKGFVLEPDQAAALIAKDPRNKEVLFPYLNGEDLNNDPQQKPSRWVINFFDWSEEKARTYPDCFEIVERLVKPERMKLDESKSNTNKQRKKNWWRYGSDAKSLYETISKVDQVMVSCRVSKYMIHSFLTTNIVFDVTTNILVRHTFYDFAYFQSSIHDNWAWKYASTMKGDMRYTNGSCIDTFPIQYNATYETKIQQVGELYYKKRKNILERTDLGLTKLYNQFHNPELAINDTSKKRTIPLIKHLEKKGIIEQYNIICELIYELRSLQKEMDFIVASSYGWNDINLNHNFYELPYLPENDNVRFTIHPDARKKVLKRLLLLNHQLHKEGLNI